MQPQANQGAVGDADVHLVDERRAHVRVGEVVPARRGEGDRRPPELTAQPLIQQEEQVADLISGGDLLADGVRLRDERRAVAAGVVHPHRAVAAGVGPNVDLQREAHPLGEVHRDVRVVDAHLIDRVVITSRVHRARPREDHRPGDRRVAVDEIELQPGVRHHPRVRELVRVHGDQRRRMEHQAALVRHGLRPLVQSELRRQQKITVEVEDVLARQRRLDAERDGGRRAGRLRLAGVEADPGDPVIGAAVRHRHRGRGQNDERPEADS